VVVLAQEGQKLDAKAVAAGRATVRQRMSRATEEAPRMSGNLEEIPLPDLLQLFGTSRKDGVLVLSTDAREGRIYLKEGKVRFAAIEGVSLLPLKAVYRMLGWAKGVFALDPPEVREFENGVDASAHEILMEGFRQQDELNQLRTRLPPLELKIGLKMPLEPKLSALSQSDMDLLQMVINAPCLEAVFDMLPGTDLETGQAVMTLVQRGYLEPVG
ncbi:MAG TPA: DUF4388 domain-containing protein, partial [Polyangiaceae bacterium]